MSFKFGLMETKEGTDWTGEQRHTPQLHCLTLPRGAGLVICGPEERTGWTNVGRELDWLHNWDGSQKSKHKGERPKATHERPMMHERACARVGVVGSPLAHARHNARSRLVLAWDLPSIRMVTRGFVAAVAAHPKA